MSVAPMNEGPQRLGAYELLSPLGQGGKGEVFLARAVDGKLKGRTVAIKRLSARGAADPQASKRIVTEAQMLALMLSPAIVRLLDFGKAPSGPFLALEVLDGGDLGQLVRRCRARKLVVPLPVVGLVMATLLRGLGVVHSKTVTVGGFPSPYVHCDVSPANLFVSRKGELRLGDFGSVRAGGERVERVLTDARPTYLSPEALDGEVTVQRDLWAAAVTAWELLTLEVPFAGDSLEQLQASIRACAPKKLRQLRPDAPPGLELVLQRAFSKDPLERFLSAGELAQALAVHFDAAKGTPDALAALLTSAEGPTGTSGAASPRT